MPAFSRVESSRLDVRILGAKCISAFGTHEYLTRLLREKHVTIQHQNIRYHGSRIHKLRPLTERRTESMSWKNVLVLSSNLHNIHLENFAYVFLANYWDAICIVAYVTYGSEAYAAGTAPRFA